MRVGKVFPLAGPVEGGMLLSLQGVALNRNPFNCVFGASVNSLVTVDTSGSASCRVPPGPEPGLVLLTFSLVASSASVPSESILSFLYFKAPDVLSVHPQRVQTSGELLTIFGRGFLNTTDLGIPGVGIAVVLEPKVGARFSLANAARVIEAVLVNSTMLTALAPSQPAGVQYSVFVSNNFYQGVAYSYSLSSNASLSYVACQPGFFAKTASEPCRPCPPGTFSAVEGSPSCERCPVSSYSSNNATSNCTRCPANSDSRYSVEPPSSLSDCRCSESFYDDSGSRGVGVACIEV